MNSISPIGTTKGPGESPHEYTLITPDRDQTVRNGEFVYYEASVGEKSRRVLGRITGRRLVRLFPDGFLADPDVPPATVAAMVGYEGRDHEIFEITVTIVGYYDETLGDFVNPRLPPRAGTPIYLADSPMLAEVLSNVFLQNGHRTETCWLGYRREFPGTGNSLWCHF